MNKPYWQPYWYQMLFRADREPAWTVMGPPPFLTRVPNDALKKASLEVWERALLEGSPYELDDRRGDLLLEGLEVWACALLEDAEHELTDLRGDLLLECYDESAPADGTPPVYSRQIRLPG